MNILQSIHPKYCELIASGKKTIEVRKTKPRIPTPFKAYIYETKTGYVSKSYENDILVPVHYGKVIGEYVCDRIDNLFAQSRFWISEEIEKATCLKTVDILQYSKGADRIYGYHISNLKIYDQPKELSEFYINCSENAKCKNCDWNLECDMDEPPICGCDGEKPITRAPQSWCYVEEL